RTDVLPTELQEILFKKYAEIPNFGGYHYEDSDKELKMIEQLITLANQYKKDMEYQTMVLNRRINSRVSEKVTEDNKQISSF
ncbi:MAG: hypothetical protein KGD61_09700, partial [Candidatus Lokiarchaeota archaeon]|nr:hypothetical protein [Candidatus Lokiarchaeota archaeon]